MNATASSLAHVVYVAAPASPYTQHSPVFRTSILSLCLTLSLSQLDSLSQVTH